MGDAEGASKKRVAGRQISKDHPESDDDASEPEMGTFKKASEEVMASRRVVKVRRNQPAAAASSNPFAGICLFPPKATDPSPQAQGHGDAPATEPNNLPETSIQEKKEPEVKSPASYVEGKEINGAKLDKTAVSSSSGNADEVRSETTDVKTLPAERTEDEHGETPNELKSETAGGDHKDARKEDGEPENAVKEDSDKEKPDEKQEDKVIHAGPFSSFKQLSSGQNAFTGFTGTGFSTSSFGFGSFATGASTLGASSGSLFGFSNENASEPVNGDSSSAPLNSATDSTDKSGKLTLQKVPVETGEENEKAVFAADAILYEYLDGGWKERGKGELKLNVSFTDAGKARLVMRARGNYRLILNASLYPDMSLTNMEKRGVTFACVNSAGEGKTGLTTIGLKFKDSSFVEEFRDAVLVHKGKSNADTAVNPPDGADEQV